MSGEQRRRGPYPAEVRERAVRMVFEHEHEYPSQWKAVESISALSINHETLRIWVRKAEVDAGQRPGLMTDERVRMRELERENRAASGQRDLEGGGAFLRGGARPPVAEVIVFIDAHRERFGVEPICRVLTEHGCKIAPNTRRTLRCRSGSLLRRLRRSADAGGAQSTLMPSSGIRVTSSLSTLETQSSPSP